MPVIYYDHLIYLVVSLEILLNISVKRDSLISVKLMLKEFVMNISLLYDEFIMVSGIHDLLHLVECTEKFGPLNITNCFQFEELNRSITLLINGKDLIGEEFYKLFTIAQSLSYFIGQYKFQNQALIKFIEKHQVIKSSNIKKIAGNQIKVSCSIVQENNPEISNLIQDLTSEILKNLPTISRCYYGNILFTDETNPSKFCDSFVKEKDSETYGSIKRLVYSKDKIFVVIQKYIFFNDLFCNQKYPEVKSRGFICKSSSVLFLRNINSLEKGFFLQNQ